jgi:type IV pilus assembly protein PilW
MINSPSNITKLFKEVRGFSLVELLVTLAIVGMMMTAVYAVHLSNLRAVRVEEDRVEMQQDQRIAVDFIARELRLAGYDRAESLIPTIVDARSNFIYFTADLNDDGDVNDAGEHVSFCMFDSDTGLALSYITGDDISVGQGTPTDVDGPISLAHTHGAHIHQVFSHIQEIEFFYTLNDGTTTTDPGVAQMDEIRSVEVTLLSRATDTDPRWVDNLVYTPPSGTAFNGGNPYGDNIRRRLLTTNVRFRNMGL